jgi:hypothetical protein
MQAGYQTQEQRDEEEVGLLGGDYLLGQILYPSPRKLSMAAAIEPGASAHDNGYASQTARAPISQVKWISFTPILSVSCIFACRVSYCGCMGEAADARQPLTRLSEGGHVSESRHKSPEGNVILLAGVERK